jgi:hypothetical protein
LLIYRSSLIARRPISTSVADLSITSHCKKTHLHLSCWYIDHLSLQEDPSPPLLLIYRSSLIARRPTSPARYKKNINSSSLCLLLPQSRNEQQFAFFVLHTTTRWFQA